MADNKLSAQVTIDTQPAVNSLGKLNKSVKGSAEVLKSLKPSAAAGGSALNDFNRIVQDAPFGIIGISNNVTQLGESFGRLKEQTGSGKAAIISMIKSLSGAGGIGFAISAVTTALTFASVGFGAWTRGLDMIGKANDKAKESAEEYKKSLKSIADGLAEEATRVSVLVNAIQSETLTRKERLGAIKELQRINPQYFGDLKDEKDLVDNLKVAYNGYIAALKEQFAAKALDKKIADLFSKKIDLEFAIDQGSASRAAKDLGGITKAEAAKFADLLKKPFLELTKEESKFIDKIQARKAKTNLFDFSNDKKELSDIDRQIDELLNKRTELGQFEIKPDVGKDGKENLVKTIKRVLLEAEFELPLNKVVLPKAATDKVNIPVSLSFEPVQQDAFEVAKKSIENFAEQLQNEATKVDVDLSGFLRKPIERELKYIKTLIDSFKKNGLTADSFVTAEAVTKAQQRLAAMAAAFQTLQTNIRNILSTFTIDAFASIGEIIGEGLANGAEGIKKAAAGLGSLIGTLFVNLGKEMIKASSLITALQIALKKLSGPASLAAGIALVALGSALKSKLGNIGATAFANGGIITGPTLGMVGEAGQPEVILPLSKINQFMEQGQGGGGNLTLAVDFNKFIFGVNRGTRRNNRLF